MLDYSESYQSMRERSPWTIDVLLATAAAKIEGVEEINAAREHALLAAKKRAMEGLFGPTERLEEVQAMMLLSAWSANGYLSVGHAVRMGIEIGLDKALKRLAVSAASRMATREASGGTPAISSRERELMSAARTCMILYWFDHTMSTSTGRPHRSPIDDDTFPPNHLSVYLHHPLVLSTDYNLVSSIELIAIRKKIERRITMAKTNFADIFDYCHSADAQLTAWGAKWDNQIGLRLSEASIERASVKCALAAAKIFLFTTALKGQSISSTGLISKEARQLALLARQSAADFLSVRLLLAFHSFRQ